MSTAIYYIYYNNYWFNQNLFGKFKKDKSDKLHSGRKKLSHMHSVSNYQSRECRDCPNELLLPIPLRRGYISL